MGWDRKNPRPVVPSWYAAKWNTEPPNFLPDADVIMLENLNDDDWVQTDMPSAEKLAGWLEDRDDFGPSAFKSDAPTPEAEALAQRVCRYRNLRARSMRGATSESVPGGRVVRWSKITYEKTTRKEADGAEVTAEKFIVATADVEMNT